MVVVLLATVSVVMLNFLTSATSSGNVCDHGSPQVNGDGVQVYCGRGGERCCSGYKCNIHPTDRWAVCCPEVSGFPECPKICPKGKYATEVVNGKGVLVCICKDPCKGHHCSRGETCVPQEVVCVRAPCPPIPSCQPCFPTCPKSCPKGKYATEVVNSKGVPVNCICKDPCKGYQCLPGEMCVPQEVQCVRAPCPPIPSCQRICKYGAPQLNGQGTQVYCGRGGERCCRGYKCTIHPADRYAVCCPKKPRCRGGRVWNECGSACTPTCKEPSPICTMQCVARCECPYDRPILKRGRCVKESCCKGKH